VQGVDLQGVSTSLHSIQGKTLLVNFWATWCAPCMQELPALQSLHTQLQDRGFKVVGIAVGDSVENIREAVARFGITFPVIVDEAGKSKRKFEVKGLPESFVLDAERRVLVVQDPGDGSPVTKIIGPREWTQNRALQLFKALVQ
jgi:thiol-disulfide isomerase/thioredoxin